jgi:hypothetical protein
VSPFEAVATVIAAFFGFGIAMGVLIVVALPVFRHHGDERRRRRRNRRRYLEDRNWREPPSPYDDEGKPPAWPGD